MRFAAALALLIAASAPASAQRLDGAYEWATEAFEGGVASRSDSPAARSQFADAARWFDIAWGIVLPEEEVETNRILKSKNIPSWFPPPPCPALALNRGHAHFLAGNLPQAIRAFHDGLALAPYDAELQQSLAAARATIDYPNPSDPAERTRPDPPSRLRNRVAPWDLYRAAVVCWVLIVVGLGKRFTTQPGWAVPVAAAGGVGFLVIAACGWQMHRERLADEANPVAVVATDGVTLRKGNGDSFPPRIEAKLPRGAEVRVIGRRGGWAQVELPGRAVGWLPETGVISATDQDR
jgi:hypothetical protein